MRPPLSELTFDADTHRYAYHGTPLLGVTGVLVAAGLIDTTFFTENGRTEGDYLHRALALDHEDALDEPTLDLALVPYVAGWRWLKAELGLTPLLWECPVCDPVAGYAGMFDLVAIAEDRTGAHVLWLLDYKRRKPGPAADLQLAAYRRAIVRMPEPDRADPGELAAWKLIRRPETFIRRGIVTWAANGRPSLNPCDMRTAARDEHRFLAALEVVKCKQEWGLLT